MKYTLRIVIICTVLLASNFNLVNAHTISKEQAQYLGLHGYHWQYIMINLVY